MTPGSSFTNVTDDLAWMNGPAGFLSHKNMKNFGKWVYRSGCPQESRTLCKAGNIDVYHPGQWWSTDASRSLTQVRESLPARVKERSFAVYSQFDF